jgi:hypothetical protein
MVSAGQFTETAGVPSPQTSSDLMIGSASRHSADALRSASSGSVRRARSHWAGMTLQFVRPDIRQSCILLLADNS